MADVKKQWKEREDLSISELEDLWFANRNLEMARSIILAVKDFQKISLEEKFKFLQNVFYEDSNLRDGMRGCENLSPYIHGPLLETFLFLLPEWKQELIDKIDNPYTRENFRLCTRTILFLLSYKDIYPYISISAGQVKKFVHSYLNFAKKEDMDEHLIVDVLINNQMFEELVNYNFVSDESVKKLWDFLFTKPGNYADEYLKLFPNMGTWYCRIEDAQKRQKELLLSWDKVENRHALATLWILLAKRGDLEKIFREPQPQVYSRTVNPDPTRIISG